MVLLMENTTEPESSPALTGREQKRREIAATIHRLQILSSRGLWAMALFIVICLGAWQDFSFLPSIPENIRSVLGKPPPASMMSAALALYTFSAILLILSRIMSGVESYSGFTHVGFLAGFIFFYHFAHALTENYWAILVAGLTILSLESYHIWNFCKEKIAREKEALDELERKSKFLAR
jgi:hypothetical protein